MKAKFKFAQGKIQFLVLSVVLAMFSLWQGRSLFALERADKEMVAEGNNEFALDLYSQLKNNQGNLFFSPFSISTALAMTYAGAKGNTQAEMAQALHFSLSPERLHPAFSTLMQELEADSARGGYELSIANALWGQQDYEFYPEFIDITKNYYEAGFKEVDFIKEREETRQAINRWVEEETRDKIKELVRPGVLTDLTRLVLTNAIYFKGKWMSQFKEGYTKDREFQLSNGEKVEVPMMNQKAKFAYFENENLQILELPYEKSKLAMVILLPKETSGIEELENSISPESLKVWLSGLQEKEVIVFLPKFKMTSEFQLNNALEALGMAEAFSLKADFSAMTPDPIGLFISNVIHKAFVDVNEEGTEAAAATAIFMDRLAMPEPQPIFRADRPFVFLIRDLKTASILFMGRVMDPRT